MPFSFEVGQSFQDYGTLERKVKEFEQQNFVKLCKSDCRKIKAASVRCPEKSFKDSVVYSDLKYSCSSGGKAYKSKSKGERSNQSTTKIGCPFVLILKAAKDFPALEVTACSPQHNLTMTWSFS